MTDESKPKKAYPWMDALLNKTKKVLEVGSEAADVLVHMQNGATPLGVAAVGMRVVDSVRRHRAKDPEDFFAQGWKPIEFAPLEQALYQSFLADEHAKIDDVVGLHDDCLAMTVSIGGFTFGFALTGVTKTHASKVRRCWILDSDDTGAALARAGRSLWDTLKTNHGVLTSHNKSTVLIPELSSEIFSSSKGDEIYARSKRFLDLGHHRSIFLIGEPGVGKSCILRYIASLHGGFSLRIHLADVSKIDSTTLTRTVEILRPDILMIDDFDRYVAGVDSYTKETKASAVMLDPLVRINELVPLFMVSANYSDAITDAVLRPGRFDEILQIDEVDPALYEQLLPNAPKKILDGLRRVKVPAAYIQELKKRVDVLGYEDAAKEMKELLKRGNKVLKENNRKVRTKRAILSNKTPRQRAAMFERRAMNLEHRIHEHRMSADKYRERAEAERAKALAQDEKKKAKKKPKKKTVKKA